MALNLVQELPSEKKAFEELPLFCFQFMCFLVYLFDFNTVRFMGGVKI